MIGKKEYNYEYETGFYYLQSRYYDAKVCRFINADQMDVLVGTVPKVVSWASKFLSVLRTVMWRIGFVVLSHLIGKLISGVQWLFNLIISKLKMSDRNQAMAKEAVEIIFCLFSIGGIIALFLDAITDGNIDGMVKII